MFSPDIEQRFTWQSEVSDPVTELLTLFCRSLGLEVGIRLVFDWLAEKVPCTRMVCLTVNRRTRIFTPLLEWTTDPALRVGARKMQWSIPLDRLPESMGMTDADGVGICDDVRQNPLAMAYWEQMGTPQRASMSTYLYASEERTVSIFMDSPIPGAFTAEHAAMLRLVRPPLAELINRLYLVSPDVFLTFEPASSSAVTAYDMLCQCPGLTALLRETEHLASASAAALIRGETGVGKELFAETLHLLSSRREGPFIRFNCAAVPDGLADSIFFGHEKGAFTGAHQTHAGLFEQACGGTLFLDEVGELSPVSQARLLRILESHEFQRVGGSRRIHADFRLVTATNRDLRAMTARGEFREDLFYRLHAYPLDITPLRERREDIPPLVRYFCTRFAAENGLTGLPSVTGSDVAELCLFSWPGNVRQLRHVVERLLLRATVRGTGRLEVGEVLAEEDGAPVSLPERELELKTGSDMSLDAAMSRHIEIALRRCSGRIQGEGGAAALLGVPPATLRSRMRRLGIALPRQRSGKKQRSG